MYICMCIYIYIYIYYICICITKYVRFDIITESHFMEAFESI